MGDVQSYLEHMKRGHLDVEPVTFETGRIGAYRAAIAQAEEYESIDTEKLERVKADLERELIETPPIEFIFVRMTEDKYMEMARAIEKAKTRVLRELIESDGQHAIEMIREQLENEAMLSTLGEDSVSYDAALKELAVTALMQAEGSTEEVASIIDEGDPELELTEDELDDTRPSEADIGVDALQGADEADRKRAEIVELRKEKIVERRMREIDGRRVQLEKLSVDELVKKIAYFEIVAKMMNRINPLYLDWHIYYEACDPEKPVKRSDRIVGYVPKFGSVDEVTALRESEDELYIWLKSQHDAIDMMPGTADLVRLAQDAAFRDLLEVMSGGARAEQTADM